MDGEQLHDGGRGGGGHGHPIFPRSLSHQDIMAGRVLPISEVASLPPDMVRSTDNLTSLAGLDNNNFKFSHEVDQAQAQLHHQQLAAAAGGRPRMPFPPVPKLDQLQGLPKVEAPQVIPLPVGSATQPVYPPASGFGSISNNTPQALQAQQQVCLVSLSFCFNLMTNFSNQQFMTTVILNKNGQLSTCIMYLIFKHFINYCSL